MRSRFSASNLESRKTDGRASRAEEFKEFVLLKQGRLGLAFFCLRRHPLDRRLAYCTGS
jgi:hypothetical protein